MLSELNVVGNWFQDEPKEGWQFDEFKFDDEAIVAFEQLNLDIRCLDYSARVDVGGNHTYIPCHYFLYALKVQPLVILANKYMTVFDLLRAELSPQQIKALIGSSSPSHPITDQLDPYSRKNFFEVFSDKTKRLQAKDIINGNGSDTSLRGNDDFVRSIILKALPVPDASSNMLGKIVYCLSKSPSTFNILKRKYSANIPYLFRDDSGDGLLFKVLSTLGWKGKLDSIFDTQSCDTTDWGPISSAFLLKAANVVGNHQYIETPIHYLESLGKYVFVKKGLLDIDSCQDQVSLLISELWPNTTTCNENSVFFFRSLSRIKKNKPLYIGGTNKIFYGAPGTGKSYKIHTEESKGAEKVVTVFHPDTQYNDFVGALKPKMEMGKDGIAVVTYQFRPGPFTNALVKAKSNPDKHVCLVIEEINRAPAAAVFGELFQLLDRDTNGQSTYKIDASDPDMLFYINDQLRSIGIPELLQLEIPANLSLLATMNSSDQSVMPMDAAFKRRWSFQYIEINFNNEAVPNNDFCITTANGQYNISWPDFAQIINATLIDSRVAEDRLLGPFFLNKDEIKDIKTAKNTLNGKLFVYLWDDVLRHLGYQRLFSSTYKTFGRLSSAFNNNMPIFNPDIEGKIEDKGQKIEVAEVPQNAVA